ncbi:hypothetical protein Tco_0704882 [Tanacetum coccineum]|uniref:Uncharacterized protein n=1 Tax=Tanacetum coccineum TaxID=301880 RepID=A0ABQ4Y375_9ASTR
MSGSWGVPLFCVPLRVEALSSFKLELEDSIEIRCIGRCNNYVVLQSIPCSPECKIVGQILLDHPLSYALTTVDVPFVYLQQFWKTVNKVPDTKDTIRFKLDTQDIVYTVDIFCDTLKLPVETPENPFIAPVNIEVIQSFMQRVGYQGIVDKADIRWCVFITTGNVIVRGMLIPDAFLTKEIRATNDYKEYETVFVNVVVPMNQPQMVVDGEKDEESYADKFASSMLHDDVDDSGDRIEPGSHKEHLEVVDDDDDDENKEEKKDDEMGIHPTITTSTDTTSSADLQQQLYLKMKSNLQDQANDPTLWDVLKRKFKKSSTSNTSCRDDDFHSQHYDDHQDDDAPPEGEKRVKRHKASKSSKSARGSSSKRPARESITYVTKQQQHQQKEWDAWEDETIIDEDEVIPKDETPELITKFQNNDMLSNQFRNIEEYAYHLEQTTNFIENQMVWESRQEDIRRSIPKPLVFYGPQRKPNESLRITEVVRIITDQLYGLDFMEQILVMRENDKPDSFFEADFKYLNKNDINNLYYLCRNKKVKVDEFLNNVHQKSCDLGESS